MTKKHKGNPHGTASTINLVRIIHYLEFIKKPVCMKKIREDCMIYKKYQLLDALKFLTKYRLIVKQKSDQGVNLYLRRKQ